MRIPIREQLALLILVSSLIGLGVISVATWISNHSFVLNIRASRLAAIASLKAAQVASNIDLMAIAAGFVSTRIVIQAALQDYNEGNTAQANWADASIDLVDALGSTTQAGQELLLQAVLYPKNASGANGSAALLMATSTTIGNSIKLPYNCADGTQASLGLANGTCQNLGFPPSLYPNLTYVTHAYNATLDVQQAEYNGLAIGPGAATALVLGPWQVNDTFALVSMTIPVLNNTDSLMVLGWLTTVIDGRLISTVLDSTQGLGSTGETLLLGPVSTTNLFPDGILYTTNNGNPPADFEVRYEMPLNYSEASRHPGQVVGSGNPFFLAREYPAVYLAVTKATGQLENSGALLRGHNEAGVKVACGYAIPDTDLVDWVVIVEQAHSEVWAPINRLRDILLACIFSTAALMAIIAFPMAHFASLPIRRLREATARSVEPPNATPSRSSFGSLDLYSSEEQDGNGEATPASRAAEERKEGFTNPVDRYRRKRREERELRREQRRKRQFRIPGKVKERKHLVKDELSDLTTTFNEMSDELMMQYERLEERVQQRTAELEQSKKAAEAANESKTLFIANISHELKTPLNGILGMCAIALQEEDQTRLKRSLGIIYKSGDLLLNLLTDLLTFSKNQVGQQITLDEKEFRLRDVSSQILAIFDKQAREGSIGLRVEWEGVDNLLYRDTSPERTDIGPNGTGRLKDMILWGDLQRILQVVINLVSNSLKFTPAGGEVVLIIRCLPEIPEMASRKGSFTSRQSRGSRQASSRHLGSDATLGNIKLDTALSINAKERQHVLAQVYERAPSPPPGTYLYFEFEVTDTGPGIPEHLQGKIFEPFVQGDLGLSKKYGGTGLGLSICSQLAGLMRGNVSVRSTVGEGSTFTLRIPIRHLKTRADSSASSGVDIPVSTDGPSRRDMSLEDTERGGARHSRLAAEESHDAQLAAVTGHASTPTLGAASESQPRLVGLSQPFFAASQPLESPDSQPAAMEKITADAAHSARIRVLVAEDNKVNQEVVTRMLKLEDIYDVTVAKDGQEALDLVKESMTPASPSSSSPPSPTQGKPFNLIFMDVQMPNVDGLESTRLIRQIGYQAPIVALTAFAEESNIKDCLESGMNYFLSKPIRRPQLKKVLKEYCAPIPEEEESSSGPSPEEAGNAPGLKEEPCSMIVVNAPGSGDLASAITPVSRKEDTPPSHGIPMRVPGQRIQRDDEGDVSPHTKA